MPNVKVVVTKQTQWKAQPERWSNGYTFQTGQNAITVDFMHDLAIAVRDMERSFHASHVTFPYLLAGPEGENALYVEEFGTPVAGTLNINFAQIHPELCVLAESKVRQRVYLRKWYRPCAAPSPGISTNGNVPGQLITEVGTPLAKLRDGTLPNGVIYCSPNGALATQPFTIDPWIHSRQLREGRRRP